MKKKFTKESKMFWSTLTHVSEFIAGYVTMIWAYDNTTGTLFAVLVLAGGVVLVNAAVKFVTLHTR